MSQMPNAAPPQGGQEPDRSTLVFVLGLISVLASCFPLGIAAWIMGNNDLRKMRAGQMNASNQGLTNAGRILGMVSVILAIVIVVFWILIFAGVLGCAACNIQMQEVQY